MRCIVLVVLSVAAVLAQNEPPPPEATGTPKVLWGNCPQLEPTLEEQKAKGEVIEQCLQKNPPPEGPPTKEKEDAHRETITTCALKTEGWFNDDGTYKFDRAKQEIEGKNLKVAAEILEKHEGCTKEAKETFPDKNIDQVQLYQACMDFHITKICEIKVVQEPAKEPAPTSA